MKTTYNLAMAILALVILSSCSKNSAAPAEETIPAGEFYIKATINGQTVMAANEVDGMLLLPNAGGGYKIEDNEVLTRGTLLRKSGSGPAFSCSLFLADTLANNITSLGGRQAPFITADFINGVIKNQNGISFEMHGPSGNFYSAYAAGNMSTAQNTAQIISVTPYKKNCRGLATNLDYFKVTLRFQCLVQQQLGGTAGQLTNGEAVILAARQK